MEVTADTPVSSITIQSLSFDAPQPYKAGPRTLTEGEASALNQTLAENLRNNFAVKIQDKKNAYKEANKLPDDAEVASDQLDKEELDAMFADYAKDYEFGVRKGGGRGRAPADPVEREAYNIALSRVKDKLKSNNITVSSVSGEQMDEFVKSVLAKYPEIKDEAARRVQVASSITIGDLSL